LADVLFYSSTHMSSKLIRNKLNFAALGVLLLLCVCHLITQQWQTALLC